MLKNKKYFLIAEVEEITGLSAHKLRYLEKSLNLEVRKIRNRRYYTQENINKIKKTLPARIVENNVTDSKLEATNIINKIDDLIDKFSSLIP
ncbi:MAG: MerR family transcriptional regulator [Rickettsiaceae bacterium]|nr:MerR family transcriptional regulator [Rickettsiaceae bacterium]